MLRWVYVGAGAFLFIFKPLQAEEGKLILKYEPKQCIMAPCPQFIVLKINDERVTGLGADLINYDLRQSVFSAFQTVEVQGTWKREGNYLKVEAHELSVVLKEKVKIPSEK